MYNEAINYFSSNFINPTKQEVEIKIKQLLSPEKFEKDINLHSFTDFVENEIKNLKSIRSAGSIKNYNVVLDKLKQFETEKRISLSFSSIDTIFYRKFREWFYNQKYSVNYFASIIKSIKMFMNLAFEQGVTTSQGYKSKGFAKITIESDSIYLSVPELLSIYLLDLSQIPEADKRGYHVARSKFLIGAFTALRVSDFNRLKDININDDFIRIRTFKTQSDVITPIHWVVKEIFASGFDLMENISEAKINTYIKEICRLAEINEKILINESIGGKNVQKVYEKWKLVSTHTARRSGATNMFKAGIPTISIMKITGHKTEKAFMKYIKITGEENAEMLSKHSFFKK